MQRKRKGTFDTVNSSFLTTIFAAFSFEARSRGNGQEGETLYSEVYRPWTLGADVSGTWVDDTTLRLVPGYVNRSHELGGDGAHLPPDPSMCGELWFGVDACSTIGKSVSAEGGDRDKNGVRLRVNLNATAGADDDCFGCGLRAASALESDASLAAAMDGRYPRGGDGFFTLIHCNAGPMVKTATISDPDNHDSTFGSGDQITLTFTVDTLMPPVRDKWEIDLLLTFCTPCNPKCERWLMNDFDPAADQIDAPYNGLGSEYSGAWVTPRSSCEAPSRTTTRRRPPRTPSTAAKTSTTTRAARPRAPRSGAPASAAPSSSATTCCTPSRTTSSAPTT